jgi:DNA-binding PadR family transcriptional regulator
MSDKAEKKLWKGHEAWHARQRHVARARQRRWAPWWEDFGPGWGGGFRGGPMRGPRRMRRGDIRAALLVGLAEGPGHGYELIRRLEDKSEGMWRPSPGSVYPTLQLLEDEGLVRSEEKDGRRVYQLTDDGTKEAEARAKGSPPWEDQDDFPGSQDAWRSLKRGGAQVMLALHQIAQGGSKEQVDRAAEVLQRTRRELFAIFSED